MGRSGALPAGATASPTCPTTPTAPATAAAAPASASTLTLPLTIPVTITLPGHVTGGSVVAGNWLITSIHVLRWLHRSAVLVAMVAHDDDAALGFDAADIGSAALRELRPGLLLARLAGGFAGLVFGRVRIATLIALPVAASTPATSAAAAPASSPVRFGLGGGGGGFLGICPDLKIEFLV